MNRLAIAPDIGYTTYAHYFITSLCAEEKAILLSGILKALSDVGVRVLTVTAHQLSSNAAAVDILGASFVNDNLKPHFVNPYNGFEVHYFFDAPHMLKLVRNCLGEVKCLKDRDGRKIEWKFVERLYRSTSHDIASHELTKKHLDFSSIPMKVNLAVQTLSNSVAKSMEKLSNSKSFMNSEGTVDFIGRFDKLFDIFNSSKSIDNNIFKSPVNSNSKSQIFAFLDDMDDYLNRLVWKGRPIINSLKSVPFRVDREM